MKAVNILQDTASTAQTSLESVHLSESDAEMVFFTGDGGEEDVHYCEEDDIRGYVVCNKVDCPLCKVGRKKEARILLPVYLPISRSIGVLSMSSSLRPMALRPQIKAVLALGKAVVAFVHREGTKFVVKSQPLPKDGDGGETVIAEFLQRHKAGEVTLDSVLLKFSNDDLREVPQIAQRLALREGNKNAAR